MREVKFRGISEVTGEWIYGTYIDGYIIDGVIESTSEYIAIEKWEPVRSETVGQCVGLNDYEDKPIFEHDIVHIYSEEEYMTVDMNDVVLFKNGCFITEEHVYDFYHCGGDCLTVVGNVYENPEFLQEEAE